jgi:flagellar P-ring protein precursor FlgI
MVTSILPPYGQPGSRIDVTVAAIGDASSLQGGILLMTGLKGPDGQVYSVAQGPLLLGGFAAGGGGNGQVLNHPTVGRIPNGAIIERPSPTANPGSNVRLQLQRADFTTASRIAQALNQRFGAIAHADNAGIVSVALPAEYKAKSADFIAELEKLTVEPDREAKVVVNERTGTIVMGKDVHIAPVAVMQGNLTVEVQTTVAVSQPNAFTTAGTTQVVPTTTVGAKQEAARNVVLNQGATVEELVRALSAIGSSPRDIIAILQNLKNAGALDAVLEVI